MTGGGNPKGIIMRNPDGSYMTKAQVIVARRGAFKWLPVLCSNDLEHGSWWFVWGSLFTALCAIYPIYSKHEQRRARTDDFLPATDFDLTWALVIISGVFFTFGSLAFVRAFSEPQQPPLFKDYKHFQTDELLGAWLFLIGTVPAVPYMLIFFLVVPSAFYFFSLLAAIAFVGASYLFVVSCYPSDKKHENVILPLFIRIFGPQVWIIKHLANDWMAGTWFFLWANAVLTFGTFLLLLVALGVGNSSQIFIWVSGTVCSIFFLIGSFYYVSGSYPHAQQFYYETGRGHIQDSNDEVAKYKKKAKTKAAVKGQISDYSNRILRLSLKTGSEEYQQLSEDPLDGGPDIEEGKAANKGKSISTDHRPQDKPSVPSSASKLNAVNNPLHQTVSQPRTAAPASKDLTSSQSVTQSASSVASVPIVSPPTDYVHIHDENAEDDDEDVEDADEDQPIKEDQRLQNLSQFSSSSRD